MELTHKNWQNAFERGDIIVEIGKFTVYFVTGKSRHGFELMEMYDACTFSNSLTYDGPWVAANFVKVGDVNGRETSHE